MRSIPLLIASASLSLGAQQRTLTPQFQAVVSVNAPVVALTNVRLVDGTGSPARDGQTVVIEGELIRAVGKTGEVKVPEGAQTIDLAGHTLFPGIVGGKAKFHVG